MYIKVKYIRIFIDIYQHISYYAQNQKKKEENDISAMKTEMNEACILQYIFLGELRGGGGAGAGAG